MADTLQRAERRERAGGIGSDVLRKEDDRLLRGDGRFTDDVELPHTLHLAVARCPFPHARILRIDISAALELEGVRQVFVGADVVARTNPISVLRPVPSAPDLPFFALADGVAKFEGQPVVSVVATSRHVAEDAIDLIDVEYEPLPHVSDVISAMEPGAPVLHPDVLSSNLLARGPQGRGEPEDRLASADVVVEERFMIGRVTGLPMETRAIVAQWRPGAYELMVHSSSQVPHLARTQLAESLRLNESDVQVVAADVGGAYGAKLGIYPEDVLACLHAMDLRRPVKFVEDRMEHFRATTHAREAIHDFRIGATAEGRFVAMTDVYATDLGAYNSPFGSAQLSSITFVGPYRVHDAFVERRVTLTNKTPIGAYRGYGQPEVNFAREDPLQLRMRNMLRPEELPWTTPSGAVYDSGDYVRCLRMAADAVRYEARRRAGRGPRADGRYVGVGLSSFVERTGYASAKFLANRGSRYGAHESVTLRANRSGGIDLYTGVSTIGQSAETTYAQVCSEVHGIAFDAVRVHAGDTGASPLNTGAFASRTMIAAAGAVDVAARQLREKTLRIAAHVLDVDDPGMLEVSGSVVVHRADPDISVPLAVVHTKAINGQGLPEGEEPGLEATAHFEPKEAPFAYGTAAAVVAVDPKTGDFEIEQFVMVHDSGRMVNPTLVEGQVRGGLAQGFGAALMEELRYDSDTGQLVNGAIFEYLVPTSCDVPAIELQHTEVPSPVTPFGVRGVGESGTIPPGAAIVNAVCDALADFGVEINRLPLTPEIVWRALKQARRVGGEAQ
jgi:carbon-monoxide dehydrogenase large subunit